MPQRSSPEATRAAGTRPVPLLRLGRLAAAEGGFRASRRLVSPGVVPCRCLRPDEWRETHERCVALVDPVGRSGARGGMGDAAAIRGEPGPRHDPRRILRDPDPLSADVHEVTAEWIKLGTWRASLATPSKPVVLEIGQAHLYAMAAGLSLMAAGLAGPRPLTYDICKLSKHPATRHILDTKRELKFFCITTNQMSYNRRGPLTLWERHMRVHLLAAGVTALTCFSCMSTAEAAHCRPGKFYRPSLGVCVSPAAFRRDVGHAVRHHRTAAKHLARRMERVRIVYVERRVPVYLEREKATPAAGTAPTSVIPVTTVASASDSPLATKVDHRPVEPEPRTSILTMPYEMAGKQSLNPLPPAAKNWEWAR